ncbi:MAG TPA: FtsQ-type POTRA domain-containing protein [Marmoricola sp.]
MRNLLRRPSKDPLSARRRRRWWRAGRGRTIAIGALCAVLVVAGLWAVFFSSLLAARSVKVDGVGLRLSSRVQHVARLPEGRPLARVDLGAIKARVETIASIESASVSRSWPHTVTITVVRRTPVAVVDRGAGLQLLDRFGVVFGHVKHAGGRPLIKAASTTDSDALAAAGAVAGSLPRSLAREVDYIELRTANDIELSMHNGQRVLWGSAADSDQKAAVAKVLLHKKVDLVDVSVPGRPATRP